jgi:hypothetical protein
MCHLQINAAPDIKAETWLGPAALRVVSLSYASSVSVSMHADDTLPPKRECIARARPRLPATSWPKREYL